MEKPIMGLRAKRNRQGGWGVITMMGYNLEWI